MLVKEILNAKRTTFSFEFFPPKTDSGWEDLYRLRSDLLPLKPSYISITYGAGGSTRERTHDLVVFAQKETGLTVGARLPARLLKSVHRANSDDYVKKVGVHWAAEQVNDLLANKVKGIHFFTLNSSEATLRIYDSLGVQDSDQLSD